MNLLGKLFVFAFTWSVGGVLRRQEDADEDESVNRRGGDRQELDVDICNEFDNFVRELFEVEPPLGESRVVCGGVLCGVCVVWCVVWCVVCCGGGADG